MRLNRLCARLVLVSAAWALVSSASPAQAATPGHIDSVKSATVAIFDSGQGNFGSGVIIGPEYVLTAAHVVSALDEYQLSATLKTSAGDVYDYEIVDENSSADLALLRVPGLEGAPIPVGDSEGLESGEEVWALGYPLGLENLVVTRGIVSAPKQEYEGETYIQTDASLNPGNSGGPLISMDGALLGINVMAGAQNVGFAVPATRIEHFLQGTGVEGLTDGASAPAGVPTEAATGDTTGAVVGSGTPSGAGGGGGSGAGLGLVVLLLAAGAALAGVVYTSTRPKPSDAVPASAPADRTQVRLQIQGPTESRVVSVRLPVVIGRGDGVGIALDDPEVSRTHARISSLGAQLRVVDLGSRNGLVANGASTTSATISRNQAFTVGNTVLTWIG